MDELTLFISGGPRFSQIDWNTNAKVCIGNKIKSKCPMCYSVGTTVKVAYRHFSHYRKTNPKGGFSLHWASGPPRTGRSGWTSYPKKWSEKASSGPPRTFSRGPTACLPETKSVWCPTHQPIKCSSTEYLAMFTHFRSHTRIIWKGNLFDFTTIFTRLTARSCTGQRGNL